MLAKELGVLYTNYMGLFFKKNVQANNKIL